MFKSTFKGKLKVESLLPDNFCNIYIIANLQFHRKVIQPGQGRSLGGNQRFHRNGVAVVVLILTAVGGFFKGLDRRSRGRWRPKSKPATTFAVILILRERDKKLRRKSKT